MVLVGIGMLFVLFGFLIFFDKTHKPWSGHVGLLVLTLGGIFILTGFACGGYSTVYEIEQAAVVVDYSMDPTMDNMTFIEASASVKA